MNTLIPTILLALFSAGCTDAGDPYVASPPDVPLAVLHAAPDTIVVGGRQLSLSAYLWRDFMPISPADGKPLVAVLTICAADTAKLPASISCDTVWVVHDQEIWKAWLHGETPGNVKPNQISRTAREAEVGAECFCRCHRSRGRRIWSNATSSRTPSMDRTDGLSAPDPNRAECEGTLEDHRTEIRQEIRVS